VEQVVIGVIRRVAALPPARRLRVWWGVRASERALRVSAGKVAARPHGLSNGLFVTLTSYPPRFRTLHLTLETILQQSVRPDGILLWIAREDIGKLPPKVTALERRGVTICPCDDLRSYKKLVFALEAHPDSFLVTADDDVRYPPDWLERLVDALDPGAPGAEILCHRAHRIAFTASGDIAPYRDWAVDVQDDAARQPSTDLVPTGVGGILYPPRSLDREVTNRDLFLALAPTADDLWFYWMARKAGTRHRKVGRRFPRHSWPGSQVEPLYSENLNGGNDRQIAALCRALGAPEPAPAGDQSLRTMSGGERP
jgi:hypothetical protein